MVKSKTVYDYHLKADDTHVVECPQGETKGMLGWLLFVVLCNTFSKIEYNFDGLDSLIHSLTSWWVLPCSVKKLVRY